MNRILHSLVWATVIITAALICAAQGMSDGASFGIIAGLTGAAWGALQSSSGCRRGCSQ